MSSDRSQVEFLLDQLHDVGGVSARMMFGEYAIYAGDRVVALVCDNQLFVKPTPGGRAFLGTPVEAPAYPGARPSFLIEDRLDDRDWLCELVRITARELPPPRRKK